MALWWTVDGRRSTAIVRDVVVRRLRTLLRPAVHRPPFNAAGINRPPFNAAGINRLSKTKI
ncbi:MAG: hypothetical protein AAGG75_00045 [Bacteroidota bacterium]